MNIKMEVKMQNISKFYQTGLMLVVILLLLLCPKCKDNPTAKESKESDLSSLFSNKELQLLGEKLFFDETPFRS